MLPVWQWFGDAGGFLLYENREEQKQFQL